tara:strand:- start:184 stop:564 length:381 start_codon:yes stop_codon:yes gene_type:complete
MKIENTRVKIIQKLYSNLLNPDDLITYNKSQFKKFIKDVVEGTIERQELIDETIKKYLKDDFNYERSDKILKIILSAAIFEMLYKHNNSTKLIISEYLKSAEFFLEEGKIKYLNAILDKISKTLRK